MDDIIVQKDPDGYQVKINGTTNNYENVSLLIYKRCNKEKNIDERDQLILGIDSPLLVDSLCKPSSIKEIIPIVYDNGKTLHLEVYI